MQWWLKSGYFTDAAQAGADYWLSRPFVGDGPGRDSPRWKNRRKPRRGQRYPPYGPRYQIGDRLVIYTTRIGKCPAIVEVTGEPHWDPDRIDTDDRPGDGDQWGVVTEVRGIAALPLDEAPYLERIGVPSVAVMRKGHIDLKEWQYAEAEQLIAGTRRRAASSQPARNAQIPIEAGEVEGYDVTPPVEIRRAIRREARLVRDYAKHLEAQGDTVYRNKIVAVRGRRMYTDLFNETRKQLIEAKASTNRNDVRMAIGQLADYARFVDAKARRAVLLDARPHPDLLDLLSTQGIAAVWRESDDFADSAAGAFV
jgi:hypothetical protein